MIIILNQYSANTYLLKVNNKNASVSIVDFEQVNVSWVMTNLV